MEEKTILKEECLFCLIISRKVSASIVHETADFIVILDNRPLNHGHCLVIPKRHTETFYELQDDAVGPIFTFVKHLSSLMEIRYKAEGTFVAINTKISQSVPHLHIHVVPRYKKDGLFSRNLIWRRRPYKGEEEMEEVRKRLSVAISNGIIEDGA